MNKGQLVFCFGCHLSHLPSFCLSSFSTVLVIAVVIIGVSRCWARPSLFSPFSALEMGEWFAIYHSNTQQISLENKLLIISMNFIPKSSHSCQNKWYTMFSLSLVLQPSERFWLRCLFFGGHLHRRSFRQLSNARGRGNVGSWSVYKSISNHNKGWTNRS